MFWNFFLFVIYVVTENEDVDMADDFSDDDMPSKKRLKYTRMLNFDYIKLRLLIIMIKCMFQLVVKVFIDP